MVGSQYPKFKRTIRYWPYWFWGRRSRGQPRLWPWVVAGLVLAMAVIKALANGYEPC